MTTLRRIAMGMGLATVLLHAGCGGPERRVLPGGTAHLPLRHQRALRYQQRADNKIQVFTVEMSYYGGRMIRVFGLIGNGIEFGDAQLLSNDSTVTFATDQPATIMTFLTEYRQLWVAENVEAGATWEDTDVGTQTTFVGYESVTVPAGTFADCYKTVTTSMPSLEDSLTVHLARGTIDLEEYVRQTENSQRTITRWFANGVGLVKEQINDTVRELVKVVNEGKAGETPSAEEGSTGEPNR